MHIDKQPAMGIHSNRDATAVRNRAIPQIAGTRKYRNRSSYVTKGRGRSFIIRSPRRGAGTALLDVGHIVTAEMETRRKKPNTGP